MKRTLSLIFGSILFFCFSANSQDWKINADSAKLYDEQKNTDKAIVFYQKALELLKVDSAVTRTYAGICYSLGDMYTKKRKVNDAKEYYSASRQIREKVVGRMHREYAAACHSLANCYLNSGEFSLAEPLYLEAKLIWEEIVGKVHVDYAGTCNNLAIVYKELGLYDKAEPLYIEVRQIREKLSGKENADYSVASNSLGVLCILMGQYLRAEALFSESLAIQERVSGKDHPYYAMASNSLGGLYLRMGLYEKAEPYFLQAKQIREKTVGKNHQWYAQSCNNLAIMYLTMGAYEKAEPLYHEAREMLGSLLGKQHPEYGTACNNLATFYNKIGQIDKVEPLYAEAKAIREKTLGKEHPIYAESCNNLAMAYMDLGDFDKAEALYLEAETIFAKSFGKEHADYAQAISNLAHLHKAKGDYQGSKALFTETKRIRQKIFGSLNHEYAESCNALGSLYMKTREFENAGTLYTEAKIIIENVLGKLHPDYARSCRNLAEFYWATGQTMKADSAFRESYAVNAHNLTTVFQFTNEKEKTSFVRNILGEDEKAFSFYLSENPKAFQPFALSLFHRNLILASSKVLNNGILHSEDPGLITKYNEWTDLKKYLASLYVKPVSQRKDNVTEIEEKAGLMEKELARASAMFTNQVPEQADAWQTIQHKLKATEVAIEFASFQYYDGSRYTDSIFYAGIILRKDSQVPEIIRLFEKRQLDSLLNQKNTTYGQHRLNRLYSKSGDPLAGSLYNLVWKPLEQKLTGIKTVYFAPSGLLHKISFAAISADNNVLLSDKYSLVQLNTTASAGEKPRNTLATADKIILYGGVDYDIDSAGMRMAALKYDGNDVATRSLPDELLRNVVVGFNYLSGSEHEISGIRQLAAQGDYALTSIGSRAATEESFKLFSGLNSPAVLHIATHGFFFPDPGNNKKDDHTSGAVVFRQSDNPLIRSGLALAGANNAWMGKPVPGVEDGILTAYEVSNMYLPDTKLAVLSACETGLGDIRGSEGVYGLQRAFKMAGVENLVMSLWKVPDAETTEFMQLFYKNLFAKQTIQDAFLKAQTEMKNKYRNDPYKWAAWVLIR